MKKIVLFYLADSSPTEAEAKAIEGLKAEGFQVKQRNFRRVGDRLETGNATHVTGAKIPEPYQDGLLNDDKVKIQVIKFDAKKGVDAAAAGALKPDTMKVADLKAALDEKGVEYAPNANKAELAELLKTALAGSDVLG